MFGDLQFAVFNQIILRFAMIDRVLNFGPAQQDSYYFQLIPISLSIVNNQSELPASGTTYRFTISKGQQKFDENKIPVEANFQKIGQKRAMVINTCRLNFYLPNYSKLRKQDFSFVVVQREHNQDYELGEYKVSTDELITQFKENNKNRFEFKSNFSEDYELQFQIYVEKNRMGLERNIRENKAQRINKSPLRSRKEERVDSPKRSFSPRQEEAATPSRDNEQVDTVQPTSTEEEKVEVVADIVEEKIEQVQEPAVQAPKSSPHSEKAVSSRAVNPPAAEKSLKEETQSRKTGQHVPLLATKNKQLSRIDTPGEVNMQASMRLSTSAILQANAKTSTSGESLKEKAVIWVFLAISIALIYFVMHPSRKV